MTDLAEVTQAMGEKMAVVPGKRVRLDFGETGTILLDGVANTATNDDGPADATITLSFDDFKAMANGKLSGAFAFMTGKLRIDGDMGVAMQLQSVTAKMKP